MSVRIWGVDNWLNGEERRKIFRTLSYKSGEVKGVEFVELAFLEGRLVVITLRELPAPDRREAGWIDPDDLEKLFSAPFKPRKRESSKKLPPLADFQSAAPTELSSVKRRPCVKHFLSWPYSTHVSSDSTRLVSPLCSRSSVAAV